MKWNNKLKLAFQSYHSSKYKTQSKTQLSNIKDLKVQLKDEIRKCQPEGKAIKN